MEGSLLALFTGPRRWGQQGQRRGGCPGVGLGAGRCCVGCTGRGSLPPEASLAASLPAPADLALGLGSGLLATANGSKLVLSGWGGLGPWPGSSSALPSPRPRQPPGPDSSAHPPKPRAHISSSGDSPALGPAGPGRLVPGRLVWLVEGTASPGHPPTPARGSGSGGPPSGRPEPAREAVWTDGSHCPSYFGLERACAVRPRSQPS